MLKGKALEDIVDQWAADLEVQAVEFKRLATEVQEWDRILIDNGNQVCGQLGVWPNGERAPELTVIAILFSLCRSYL